MHPKNRHHGRYDFRQLTKALPELAAFVSAHPKSGETIDFSDPLAVKTLNRALLKHFYKIDHWDVPEPYLCPGIPGRVDYLHSIADLIKKKGASVRVLDIGVGANCIYPLLGVKEYGWSFVGADVDQGALESAASIVAKNDLGSQIELRLQPKSEQIFKDVIKPGESFELTICNPPFYGSAAEAEAESLRKWKHLGKDLKAQHRNFGGVSNELYCKGGEAVFLKNMVFESKQFQKQVKWFSSLVSKEGNLKPLDGMLEKAGATEMHILEMEQGQKRTRVVAWTFI